MRRILFLITALVLSFSFTVVSAFAADSGDTLTWDGNTEGLVSVLDAYYKVSDAIPTAEDVSNGITVDTIDGAFLLGVFEVVPGVLVSDEELVLFVSEAGIGVEINDGVIFSETGVYCANFGDGFYIQSLTIPGYTGFVVDNPEPSVSESFGVLTGVTDMVDASTDWVSSFIEGITASPLLLLFVLTAFASLGISIIALVKKK